MDKQQLKAKLTEIVAVRVDVRDQNRGKAAFTDPYRWQERYSGMEPDDWHFKIEVDQFVCMLMMAVEDEYGKN